MNVTAEKFIWNDDCTDIIAVIFILAHLTTQNYISNSSIESDNVIMKVFLLAGLTGSARAY